MTKNRFPVNGESAQLAIKIENINEKVPGSPDQRPTN